MILGLVLILISCSKAQKKNIPSSSIEGAEAEYVKGEILVKCKKGATKERIEEINRRFGAVGILIKNTKI